MDLVYYWAIIVEDYTSRELRYCDGVEAKLGPGPVGAMYSARPT